MLHIFKSELDRHLKEPKFQPAVSESVRSQSTKLAAIVVPEDQDPITQQLVRRAIDESFVSGFRSVMLIGAILAVASAVTALLFVGAPKRGESG